MVGDGVVLLVHLWAAVVKEIGPHVWACVANWLSVGKSWGNGQGKSEGQSRESFQNGCVSVHEFLRSYFI